MQLTPYSEVNNLLDELLKNMQNILGDKLVGLYLYGSLVWGDFDLNTSDIDLLAAVSSDISEQEFEGLKKMHDVFVDKHKMWNDRIEVRYISLLALQTFKVKSSPAVTISTGEPFHRIEVGNHWLMNWYMVREKGVILYGPAPNTIIEPITKAEFIESVQDHARSWSEWIKNMRRRKAQAYAILTMCRALYAYRNGEQSSKKQAALWAKKELPEWATLIENALLWSEEKDEPKEDSENFSKTEQFVNYVRNEILA